MPTNDQIILWQLLEERKREVAPELSEDDYFEIFVAEQALKDYDLSYEDIEEGIVGDGGDGGIDSVHVFINGELLHEDTDLAAYRGDISLDLHLIQASRSPGFSEDVVHHFRRSSEELLDLSKDPADLKARYNSPLLASVGRFRDACTVLASKLKHLSISFYYGSLAASVHPNVEAQVGALKETVASLFSSAEFNFDFLGARELLLQARQEPTKVQPLKLAESPISVGNSFICLVRLKDFNDFITDPEGRVRRAIFDANVRDYQGDVEVNLAIRSTLRSPQGEDFWWLNNGITIIASQATLAGKTLTIRDPQIVNGLQTSLELHTSANSLPDGDERAVLVRVVIATSPASYQRIVQATNKQTSVPQASLRATDPIHRDIEDFLRGHGLYYERRKNYYKNEGRPREAILSVSYLAQAIMAILLGRCDDARARPSTLLKRDTDYIKVFDPSYPIEAFLVCARLMKRCERFLRSKGLSQKDINNLRFHQAMFVSRRVLNATDPSVGQIAKLAVDGIDETLLGGALSEVRRIYDDLGADDQAAKGPKFVERLVKRLSKLSFTGRMPR